MSANRHSSASWNLTSFNLLPEGTEILAFARMTGRD